MNDPQTLPGDLQGSANQIWDHRYATNTDLPGCGGSGGDPVDYTQHPFLYLQSILLPVTGNPDISLQTDIGRRYLTPPPKRALSIGAGTARHEERLI